MAGYGFENHFGHSPHVGIDTAFAHTLVGRSKDYEPLVWHGYELRAEHGGNHDATHLRHIFWHFTNGAHGHVDVYVCGACHAFVLVHLFG